MAENPFFIERPLQENFFSLTIRNSRFFKRPGAIREISYIAKPRYPDLQVPLLDLLPQLTQLFDTILSEVRNVYKSTDLGTVYISSPAQNFQLVMAPEPLAVFSGQYITDYVDWVGSSAQHIVADGGLNINFGVCHIPQGSGRLHVVNLERDKVKKRSVISIKAGDNLCLARAIVVGVAHAKKCSFQKGSVQFKAAEKEYQKIRFASSSLQTVRAKELRKGIGISDDTRPGLLSDVPLFEDHLKVAISVISPTLSKERIHIGNPAYSLHITLLYSVADFNQVGSIRPGHFDLVTIPKAFYCKVYDCMKCFKFFDHKGDHSCKYLCDVCCERDCELNVSAGVFCTDCNRLCRSQDCFVRHKERKVGERGKNKGEVFPSRCEKVKECPDCGVRLKLKERSLEDHVCGESQCRNCKEWVFQEDHWCFMRAKAPDVFPEKYIYFDFEAQQDQGVHIANLVVAQTSCPACEGIPIESSLSKCHVCGFRCSFCSTVDPIDKEFLWDHCENCAQRRLVFSGKSCRDDFCSWLFSQQNKNSTVIAHNAKSYDAYFLLEYLKKKWYHPRSHSFPGKQSNVHENWQGTEHQDH